MERTQAEAVKMWHCIGIICKEKVMSINIKGFDKAEVLQVLFNSSKQQGMGLMRQSGGSQLTLGQARELFVSSHSKYFDYLNGRVMKVDLSGDELDPYLYDRDNGQGAAARALAPLLEKQTA
jgi:hypothetical protein